MPGQLFIYQNIHKPPRLARVLAALFGCVSGNTCASYPRVHCKFVAQSCHCSLLTLG